MSPSAYIWAAPCLQVLHREPDMKARHIPTEQSCAPSSEVAENSTKETQILLLREERIKAKIRLRYSSKRRDLCLQRALRKVLTKHLLLWDALLCSVSYKINWENDVTLQ